MQLLLGFAFFAVGAASSSTAPIVKLGDARVLGVNHGNVSSFLGLPFAEPPIGSLRFRLPEPVQHYSGSINATAFGHGCPQLGGLPSDLPTVGVTPVKDQSEDCLSLNVIRPSGASTPKLPVVVWIHGGAFAFGASSLYDGRTVVERSLQLEEPVLYVSFNYRLNVFGFLGGREVKLAGAGNLGLWDQRLALRWVHENIEAFGGDPSRVTIWGESAGAFSVGFHMVTNGGNTEGLFRAAVMESGSVTFASDITTGQTNFDIVVNATGCSSSKDSLGCLRQVPFNRLMDAANKTIAIFPLTWLPHVDGKFLTQSADRLITEGKYARIPVISGVVDDEGTILTSNFTDVVTDEEFKNTLRNTVFPNSTTDQVDRLAVLYPSDPAAGSPFNTGNANAITPQYKRLAAILGDEFIQTHRRFFLNATSRTQDTWSFVSKHDKDFPTLGSFHTSDIPLFFATPKLGGDFAGADALINFANNLDPNVPKHPNSSLSKVHWPKYSVSEGSIQLLTLTDPDGVSLSPDTFREDAISFLTAVQRQTGVRDI